MEKIADVLRRKYPQFNTVYATASVKDALYQMFCENVDYLIVQDEGDRFAGLLTEHDIAGKVLFSTEQLNNVLVKDFMTTAIPVATVDDSLEYAMQMLEHYNAKFLAVYDQFTFKGIVSAQDLMREALNKRKDMFADEPQAAFFPQSY